MYNFEKYFEYIGIEPFGLVNGEIKRCHGTRCNMCDFCEPEIECDVLRRKWLMEGSKPEYKYYVTYMTEETVEAVYTDREKPLNTLEELENMRKELEEFAGYDRVVILNWRELEA